MIQGNFAEVEALLSRSAEQGLFQEHITSCTYTPVWRKIPDAQTPDACVPSMRGGHQMCMDVEAGIIYLIGGWDGSKDLADFWAFSVAAGQWTCLSADTKK